MRSLEPFLLELNEQRGRATMLKYVIEREIPNAGSLSGEQGLAISQKSCSVSKNLEPQIPWVESLVRRDKIYCGYIAPNEAMVREHAKQGGFLANRVSEEKRMIDPTSAAARYNFVRYKPKPPSTARICPVIN
jgi:Protein of unknown function (DUF4242)